MMQTWNANSFGFTPVAFAGFSVLVAMIMIIVVALKGYSLWHAARRSEKWWFIILLIVNTLGILELIYLFFVVGKWHKFKDNGTPSTTNV